MPPLGQFDTRNGFIPDYPLLLMFDEFLIDGEAVERISAEPPWLGEWPRLVQMLADEGALATTDVAAEAARVGAKRGGMLRRDMRRPEAWLSSMAYHDSLIAQLDRAFGRDGEERKSFRWNFDPHALPGFKGDDGHYHALSGCPLDPDISEGHVDEELREQALSELAAELREVNATLAVAARLGVVPMPWAPYAKYIAAKATHLPAGRDDLTAARLFFEIAFPRYRPGSIRDFARLRADKRIRALRDVIRQAYATGDVVDPKYPQRILEEVLGLERGASKWRKVTGWIAALADFVPVPGAGAVAKLAEELTGAVIDRRAEKPLQWFYLISNGRGLS